MKDLLISHLDEVQNAYHSHGGDRVQTSLCCGERYFVTFDKIAINIYFRKLVQGRRSIHQRPVPHCRTALDVESWHVETDVEGPRLDYWSSRGPLIIATETRGTKQAYSPFQVCYYIWYFWIYELQIISDFIICQNSCSQYSNVFFKIMNLSK